VLVWVETHKAFPMLDLSLFRDRSFRTPNIVSFAATGALMGVLFLLPLLLQGPRGLSALQSGLTTFPQALGVLVTARLVGGYLYPRVGPRRIAMIGMAGNAIITAMFLGVDLETSQWTIRALMFTRGLSLGFIFIPVQTAAFAQVTPERTGRASALYQTQRQVGAAVGVAILATMFVERFDSLGGTSLPPAAQGTAFLDAFHFAIFGSVILCLVGFAAAFFLRDRDAAPTMRRVQPTVTRSVPAPSPAAGD
jgi:MFS family permease